MAVRKRLEAAIGHLCVCAAGRHKITLEVGVDAAGNAVAEVRRGAILDVGRRVLDQRGREVAGHNLLRGSVLSVLSTNNVLNGMLRLRL